MTAFSLAKRLLPAFLMVFALLGASAAQAGTALQFNGTSQYVTMGAAATTLGASNFTIECWFKRTGTGLTTSTGTGGVTAVPLVTKGRGESDGSNVDCNYFLGINSSGQLVADFEAYPATGITAGQNYPVTANNAAIQNNVWYHAAATYDTAIHIWRVYLNGTQVGSATPPAGAAPRYDSIQHFGVGTALTSTGSPAGFFQGVIDEVRVWNYARSAADILAAKDYEILAAPGLIGRYGLNEGTGTVASNSAVGGGTPLGALTNGPIWVDGAPFVLVNVVPVVSLDTPAEGASFTYPSPVTFSATASDSDGTIAKVEFYANGSKVGEAVSSPFTFNWPPPATGSYAITARALDNLGAATTTAAATITIIPNPNQPPVITLNAPLDSATVFGSSTTLALAIADPERDNTTVTFYARRSAPPTPGPDFSMIVLPDTQFYSQNSGGSLAPVFNAQTQWVVDNHDLRNTAFVNHMGDITQNGDNNGNPSEWLNADAAMAILERPILPRFPYGIPFGILPGNHDLLPGDQTATGVFYNQYFGTSRFAGRTYYGGHYGSTNNNNYELFSASGLDFIAINLAYRTSADQAILDWADRVLKAYPDRRAIVTSHWIVNTGDQASFGGEGQAIYDYLKGNPNFFLMLCGHVNGEGKRSDTFQNRTVYSILSDYQDTANGGNGFLRILTFSPGTNRIHVESYSPTLGRSVNGTDGIPGWTDAYDLSYDMQSAVSDWTPIGTINVPGISVGGSFEWTGLQPGASYEWYASASDGINVVSTPVHRFSSQALTDISGQTRVTVTSFTYNRATRLYTGSLTIQNTGAGAITGPIFVALNSLTSGVMLFNSNGSYNGAPYIAINQTLNNGATVTVPVQFSNPSAGRINFAPVVLRQ